MERHYFFLLPSPYGPDWPIEVSWEHRYTDGYGRSEYVGRTMTPPVLPQPERLAARGDA